MSKLTVEVVYADPPKLFSEKVELEAGSCIRDAIEQSTVLAAHPEIELGKTPVGIFSRQKRPEHKVSDGDRVEIYRPLLYRYRQPAAAKAKEK